MRSDRPDPSRASTGRTSGPGRRLASALAAGLALALCAGTTAACDLRREGAAAITPSPDATEEVRQRAAQQASALAASAATLEESLRAGGAAAVGAPAADAAALATALAGVREAARTHLDGLGGVWVPFPAETSPAPQSPSGAGGSSAAPSTGPDAASLVADLTTAGAAAQTDAAAVEDGRLARLLASIGLADELWAARLAQLCGLPAPEAPAAVAPDAAGLSAETLAPLIASEDALGAAWELDAARSQDAARDAAASLAAAHRTVARTWAQAAGGDGVAGDPRRAAYDLPTVLTDPASAPEARTAVLAGLEDRLGGDWLDLVEQAAPGARGPFVSAARVAVTRAIALSGAAIPVLPGVDPAVASAG